jgi:hypothetical protein
MAPVESFTTPLNWMGRCTVVPLCGSMTEGAEALGCSCAATRTGITSSANKVVAVMHVNVLDFMLPPLHLFAALAEATSDRLLPECN